MKKVLSVFFCFIVCFAVCISCLAFEYKNHPIVDKAGYLTQGEYEEIYSQLEEFRLQYNFDLAIYTESQMSGSTAKSTTEDIYDYMDYGASDGSGLILYICKDSRDYYFFAHKRGAEYFNDNGLRYLDEQVVPYLSDDDYYGAFCTYIETAEKLIEMALDGNPYNVEKKDTEFVIWVWALGILVPLVIAFAMMLLKLKKMKTAVKNNYAENYIKPGSMHLSVSRDLFLFSKVTKIKKASSSGSRGSSSGGGSRGRGGKF